jgi:hypothetical protein
VQVEEQRARGVAGVGDVQPAAAQLPHQPAVDGAEGELAALGALARAGDVVEQPGQLGGGEIGIELQAGARAHVLCPAAARRRSHSAAVRRSCQTIAGASGATLARSHSTVVSRWLAMPMAATSRRPRRLGERPRARSRAGCAQDVLGIVLDPVRARVVLARTYFLLGEAAHAAGSASNTIARELVVPWSRASR